MSNVNKQTAKAQPVKNAAAAASEELRFRKPDSFGVHVLDQTADTARIQQAGDVIGPDVASDDLLGWSFPTFDTGGRSPAQIHTQRMKYHSLGLVPLTGPWAKTQRELYVFTMPNAEIWGASPEARAKFHNSRITKYRDVGDMSSPICTYQQQKARNYLKLQRSRISSVSTWRPSMKELKTAADFIAEAKHARRPA